MKLHTIDELALHLGVCAKTVRNWITQGKIKIVRIGKKIRISSDEVARISTEGV